MSDDHADNCVPGARRYVTGSRSARRGPPAGAVISRSTALRAPPFRSHAVPYGQIGAGLRVAGPIRLM